MAADDLHGLLAEYPTAEALLTATRRAREAGYTAMDAYTPYPVEGLAAELGMPRTRVPSVVLICGFVGAGVGFLMQAWTMGVNYPFDVGGRPYLSWPVYIPITFEVLVLIASLGAFFGMLFLNGLPKLHHPLFSVPGFERSTQDTFFLCIEAADPKFDPATTRAFLAESSPAALIDVPRNPS